MYSLVIYSNIHVYIQIIFSNAIVFANVNDIMFLYTCRATYLGTDRSNFYPMLLLGHNAMEVQSPDMT